MRFKITLEVDAQKYGNILPISYQYELTTAVNNLLMSDSPLFENWLNMNQLSVQENQQTRVYSISNLYVPKIFVDGDRLHINVPRVQFWISVFPFEGTEKFLRTVLLGKEMIIGDSKSSVAFTITDISFVTPVRFNPVMEYQTLSPLVVVGMRPNGTVEYLNPHSRFFGQFMIDELIERWEFLFGQHYLGDRRYKLELLMPERRKAVTIFSGTTQQQKVVGFMMKFRLTMDPALQEIAYTLGLGDKINMGFGYIELLKKEQR